MATISSIGTASRNYSTIQAWHDAFATGGWIGELYNDSEFVLTGNPGIMFFGKATSTTDFMWLRCATGQSFRDNAGAASNPLRYDQTKGVGLRGSTAYAHIELHETDLIFSGIQYLGPANAIDVISGAGADRCTFENMLCESVVPDSIFSFTGQNTLFRNCVFVKRHTLSNPVLDITYWNYTLANCTLVMPTDFSASSGAMIRNNGGSVTLKNCAMFGFGSLTTGSGTFSGSNNASNLAIGFGTANQASKTFANQFVGITDAARDWRLKSGADCINTGVTDTTDIPTADDIVKTTRPQGASWDIGAWEFSVAGQSSGTATGTGAASGVGRAAANAVGTASGAGTALGVSPATVVSTPIINWIG